MSPDLPLHVGVHARVTPRATDHDEAAMTAVGLAVLPDPLDAFAAFWGEAWLPAVITLAGDAIVVRPTQLRRSEGAATLALSDVVQVRRGEDGRLNVAEILTARHVLSLRCAGAAALVHHVAGQADTRVVA